MSAAAVIEYGQPTEISEELWTDLESEPFTKVPNRFLNRIQHKLTPIQIAMMNHVFRQTIGFHRRSASISNAEFTKASHSSRRAVIYAKRELIQMGLLVLVQPGKGFTKCRYAVNLYFDMDIEGMKKGVMQIVKAAFPDEPEPAPETEEPPKGIRYREVPFRGFKIEHPGYRNPIQMPKSETEKVYKGNSESEKTQEPAQKADKFSVQQSPAATIGIQPVGTPEANTQEKVYNTNNPNSKTDEPNNHAAASPLAASDAAKEGIQQPDFLKIVDDLKSNSIADPVHSDTPPEPQPDTPPDAETPVKPMNSSGANVARPFKRVPVPGPVEVKDKQYPKVDTKRDKRKAIASVCRFLIQTFKITLTSKEYAFINYFIREWGSESLLQKVAVMKRQLSRGQKIRNPLGWLNSAQRGNWDFSQNDKIKMRSDEFYRKQSEAYRKKLEEDRIEDEAQAAESAYFKAIKAKMDPKAKAKLREDALKQIDELGIKPDWVTEELIISIENQILRSRAAPDGNV